jgi:hypothetical protein
MLAILTIWEAEIRTEVQRQPRQKKLCEIQYQQIKKVGMVAYACHSSDSRKHKIGGSGPG